MRFIKSVSPFHPPPFHVGVSLDTRDNGGYELRKMEILTLRSGVSLPWPAVKAALELEARGFVFRAQGDRLLVSPPTGTELTPEDRAMIKRWKPHIMAILAEPDPWSGP